MTQDAMNNITLNSLGLLITKQKRYIFKNHDDKLFRVDATNDQGSFVTDPSCVVGSIEKSWTGQNHVISLSMCYSLNVGILKNTAQN